MATAQRLTTVELYGVPSILAGRRELAVAGGDLAQLSRALAAACPALVGPVLDPSSAWIRPGYTFVVEGRFTREPGQPVGDETAVLLVSSAAGG